jgi:ectoine hydroxylase-related dioxygenase (phytanoyl-CoA dioxygenase family)
VLGDDEVELLRLELDRVIRDHDTLPQKPVMFCNIGRSEGVAVWQIVDIWLASKPYRNLMSHSKITSDIAQLTEADSLRIWHDQIVYKPPGVGGINKWHQDAPLWPVIEPMAGVAAWVALDDVDASNGCMSMVPGSHCWGDHMRFLGTIEALDALPTEFLGHAVQPEFCPVRKGEVHYHHALTWHSSHENESERPRRAIAFHYMLPGTRYVASGEHVMKPYITVPDGEALQGAHFPVVYP